MCRAVLPGMLEHGGAIVNTVSTAGMKGQPYSAAYCASKGGVRLLTMALAVEYMARGVRVNGVAPGGVDTPIIHNFGPPEDADWKLIERLMTPDRLRLPARDRRGVRLPRFAARPTTSPGRSSPSTGRSRPEHLRHAPGAGAGTPPRRARCDAVARAPHRRRCLLPRRARRPWRPRPGLDVAGLRGELAPAPARSRAHLPAGVPAHQRPMPARPLHALWARGDTPPLEWFVGPTDVVHGTNFVVPPTSARRRGRLGARPHPAAPPRAVQRRRRWPIPG